jgi:hypothetical protein
MKSFERLVLSHLKSITDPLLDPMQIAYRANRSVDDAVNMALHFILQHLDSAGTYARILFVDYSSAHSSKKRSIAEKGPGKLATQSASFPGLGSHIRFILT